MKRIYAMILVAIAIAMPLQAQIDFGLKAGLNLTEMSLSQSELEKAISNKSGFFVGPIIKFTLPVAGLGIDAAALYDQREGELKGTENYPSEKLKQKSIQIPVNVRFDFGLGDMASIYIFAGPQFGFNIGGDTEKQKVADWSLKTANISGNAGLGVMLVNHLQVSVNYNFALSKSAKYKVYDTDGSDAPSATVKNNAWQLALAYYF